MARCRVCHRPMTNPAHIAAGVGPICAQRAARYGVGTGEQASYPAERLARLWQMIVERQRYGFDDETFALVCHWYERLARVERALARLGQMIVERDRYGFDDETFALVIHWYERWQRIERAVAAD